MIDVVRRVLGTSLRPALAAILVATLSLTAGCVSAPSGRATVLAQANSKVEHVHVVFNLSNLNYPGVAPRTQVEYQSVFMNRLRDRFSGVLRHNGLNVSDPVFLSRRIGELPQVVAAIGSGLVQPKESSHLLVFTEKKAVISREAYRPYGNVFVEYQTVLYELNPVRAIWSSPVTAAVTSIAPMKSMDSFAGDVLSELAGSGAIKLKFDAPQRQNGDVIRSITASQGMIEWPENRAVVKAQVSFKPSNSAVPE